MDLVIDASAAAGWLLPDEAGSGAALDALAEAGGLAAPWLFWVELRNILLVAERRGRIAPGTAEAFLEAVEGLGVALDARPSGAEVLRLARGRGLSAYDALYLELALRRGAGLMTLDRALAGAAEAEGVPLVADSGGLAP